MKNDKFISLFDFLGKAAGGKLGIKINKIAQERKQPRKTRWVENPKYTGKIQLYTETFLEELNQEGHITQYDFKLKV